MKNKKNKIKKISLSLVATGALVSGVAIASVAQASVNDSITDSPDSNDKIVLEASDQEIVTEAIRGLNDSNSTIPSIPSQAQLYGSIQRAINLLDPIGGISSITIMNEDESISVNADGTTATINIDSIQIQTRGGTSATYINSTSSLIISNISVVNGVITSVGLTTGLIQNVDDSVFIASAFRGINGFRSIPTDRNSRIFYDFILSEVTRMRADVDIVSIFTIDPFDNTIVVTNTANNSSTLTIPEGQLSVTGFLSSGNRTTFQVGSTGLVISDIVVNNNLISINGTISGFVDQPTPQQALENDVRALSGLTAAPSDANQLTLYNGIQDTIRARQDSNASISLITFTSVFGSIIAASSDGTSVTIEQGALVVETVGGLARTYYNVGGAFNFADVVTDDAGLITSTGLVCCLYPINTNQGTAEEAFRLLNGIAGVLEPVIDLNVQIYFDALQTLIISIDPAATINGLFVENGAVTVNANASGDTVTVNQGALFITTVNGSFSNYSNTSGALVVPNITFVNGIIVSTGVPTGLIQQTNQVIVADSFRALNGVTTVAPTDANQLFLFNALQNQIRTIDINATISGITINTPSTTVSANEFGNVLTVEPSSITITTTGGNASTYTNANVDLVLSGVFLVRGVITVVNEITGLSVQ